MALFKKHFGALVFITFLLLVWGFMSNFEIVDSIILPAPWDVVFAIPKMISRDGFLNDIVITLKRVGLAIFVACMLGIPIGLFFGYKKNVYKIFESTLHALRSVPATALFPLFLIIIGVGETSIITLAAYPSLLVILVNAVTGASLANKRRLHQAQILNLRPFEIITEVLFYEALPNIFDGVRTAVSYSLVLVVAVEMFIGVGDTGLGRKIYDYQSTYRIPETYASIAIAGTIGILLNTFLTLMESKMLKWIPNAHGEQQNT